MSFSNSSIKLAFENFIKTLTFPSVLGWADAYQAPAEDSDMLNLATLAPTWGWADRGFVPASEHISVRLSLLPASKTYLGNTGFGLVDVRGLFVAEVWGRVGLEAEVDHAAGQIESSLLAAGALGEIWLDGAVAAECRPVDGLCRATVRCPWRCVSTQA